MIYLIRVFPKKNLTGLLQDHDRENAKYQDYSKNFNRCISLTDEKMQRKITPEIVFLPRFLLHKQYNRVLSVLLKYSLSVLHAHQCLPLHPQ